MSDSCSSDNINVENRQGCDENQNDKDAVESDNKFLKTLKTFPVSYETFLKSTYYNEMVDKIMLKKANGNEAKFKKWNSDPKKREIIAYKYYKLFYTDLKIRKQYEIRLKPCPAKIRAKLMEFRSNTEADKKNEVKVPRKSLSLSAKYRNNKLENTTNNVPLTKKIKADNFDDAAKATSNISNNLIEFQTNNSIIEHKALNEVSTISTKLQQVSETALNERDSKTLPSNDIEMKNTLPTEVITKTIAENSPEMLNAKTEEFCSTTTCENLMHIPVTFEEFIEHTNIIILLTNNFKYLTEAELIETSYQFYIKYYTDTKYRNSEIAKNLFVRVKYALTLTPIENMIYMLPKKLKFNKLADKENETVLLTRICESKVQQNKVGKPVNKAVIADGNITERRKKLGIQLKSSLIDKSFIAEKLTDVIQQDKASHQSKNLETALTTDISNLHDIVPNPAALKHIECDNEIKKNIIANEQHVSANIELSSNVEHKSKPITSNKNQIYTKEITAPYVLNNSNISSIVASEFSEKINDELRVMKVTKTYGKNQKEKDNNQLQENQLPNSSISNKRTRLMAFENESVPTTTKTQKINTALLRQLKTSPKLFLSTEDLCDVKNSAQSSNKPLLIENSIYKNNDKMSVSNNHLSLYSTNTQYRIKDSKLKLPSSNNRIWNSIAKNFKNDNNLSMNEMDVKPNLEALDKLKFTLLNESGPFICEPVMEEPIVIDSENYIETSNAADLMQNFSTKVSPTVLCSIPTSINSTIMGNITEAQSFLSSSTSQNSETDFSLIIARKKSDLK